MTPHTGPGSGLVGHTMGRAGGRAEFPGLVQRQGCLWCDHVEMLL